MKKEISFHDKENNLVQVEIELKDGRFSMSGDCGGSSGQCQDEIKATPNQQRLLDLWEAYHLNDMHAGTPEQEAALKDCPSTEYDLQVKYLKEKGLYEVTLPDGKRYRYGSGWLTRELPSVLWDQVLQVCKDIQDEDDHRRQRYEMKGGTWDDIDDKKIQALGKKLGMPPSEAIENITDGDSSGEYNAEGHTYFVGTQDETEEKCKAYLTDDTESYKSWVNEQIKNGNASNIMNIDDWADYVIENDGYGHILNSWDGTEDYSGEYNYYIIKTR